MTNAPIPQLLLSIVGPTATGKTSFALWLAERLIAEQKVTGIDLISADSRQVYRELAIISGADTPSNYELLTTNFLNYPFFENTESKIRIHGVGIIGIEDDWSVSHFRKFALPIVEQSQTAGRLPIIVGGTGLYHRHLFNPELDEQPGPDFQLRAKLQSLKAIELQSILTTLSSERLAMMNESDRQNPRRLVRAIEQLKNKKQSFDETQDDKAKSRKKVENLKTQSSKILTANGQRLTIGLMDTLENIEQKIRQRVDERWEQGAIEEVKRLNQSFDKAQDDKTESDLPALTSTGVKEISLYLDNRLSEEEAKKAWVLREFQYAKRQLTWWKTETNITWVKTEQLEEKNNIYQLISTSLFVH